MKNDIAGDTMPTVSWGTNLGGLIGLGIGLIEVESSAYFASDGRFAEIPVPARSTPAVPFRASRLLILCTIVSLVEDQYS